MLKGGTQYAIAAVLISAVGVSLWLRPNQRPHEEAAFVERVSQRVESARTLSPETRDYLMTRVVHPARTAADEVKDLRRERAVDRLSGAIMQKSTHASR
jgi:hypothetical protein